MRDKWRGVVVFIAVAYGAALLIDILYYLYAPRDTAAKTLVFMAAGFARMWTPAMGAGVALAVAGRNVRRELASILGLRTDIVKYFFTAPLLAYAALGVYAALSSLLGLFDISKPARLIAEALANKTGAPVPVEAGYAILAVQVSTAYIVAVSLNTVYALGEEIGWRGYLYRELFSWKPGLAATVVIGVVWGLWHSSAIVLLGLNYPHAGIIGVPFFVLFATSTTYPLLYLTTRSKSVLPAAALHGALNALWGLAFATCSLGEGVVADLVCGAGLLGAASWAIVSLVLALYSKTSSTPLSTTVTGRRLA